MEWLLDVYEALAGRRPPADPRVIIADELGRWADAPADKLQQQLWQALRLTVLYRIWAARCSKDSVLQSPSAVASAVVTDLRKEMHLQYRRSRRREVMSQHLPPRVLEMRRLKPKTDSLKVWLESGLCSVSAQPGHDDLSISLTEAWPVPIPGHAEEE